MVMCMIIGSPPPSLSYETNASTFINGGATTHTYTSVDFGLEGATRKIILTVGHVSAPTPNITGITIGGISASLCVMSAIQGGSISSVWIADVPTGTSGDIIFSFSVNISISCFGLYAAYNLNSSVATDTGSAVGSGVPIPTFGTTIDVQDHGLMVASVLANSGGDSGTATWVGVTEDYDLRVNTSLGAGFTYSGGNYVATSSVVNRSVTVSNLRANATMAVAAFR